MKTKLFFFMAAMLLSVGAFAQSNETPLKGDVNEDGVVDVADITAVIGIIKNVQEHYFYLGTIKPTAENYKIIPGVTTSYTSFDEAVGTTVSVDAGQTLYMLCPAEWVKGKNVTLEDNSGETLNFSEEIDYTTVYGCAIYKTQVLTDAKDVTLKGIIDNQQNNYYLGIASDEDVLNQTWVDSIAMNNYSSTPITSLTYPTGGTSNDQFMLFLYPEDWGTPTLIEDGDELTYATLDVAGTSYPGYGSVILTYAKTCAGNQYTVSWK